MLCISVSQSPVECSLVDVTASIAYFVVLVKVSVLVSDGFLDALTRHQFSLLLISGNLCLASVQWIQDIVAIFSHGDGLQLTCTLRVIVASGFDGWQMHGSDGVHTVEVIIGLNRDW